MIKKVIFLLKSIRKKIKLIINKIGSKKRNKKLNCKNFTIISNNCFAGLTYEYLDMPFFSPTIGLYFFAPEYIKFIKNLKYYTSIPLEKLEASDSKYFNELKRLGQENNILGKLDDIEIVFLHYDSFDDAKSKWEKRCKRINYDNIIYKFCDQNLCTEKELKEFNELHLDNKICFTAKKYNYPGFVYMKKYKNKNFVRDDIFDYHKYIDIVSYLNKVFQGKKRILHVLYSSNFSGAENVACTLCEKFNDDYDVAYCCPDGYINKILKEKNISHISIKKFNLINIRGAIKKYNPDIIHAHDFKASCIVCFTGFKGKIVSHIHQIPEWLQKFNFKTILYNFCSKKMNKILFVSNAAYNSYYFKDKIKDKYKIIYNYVDADNVLRLAKEEYSDKFDLCFFGRLVEEKNPLFYIEILKQLKDNGFTNITACMIGNGNLEQKCNDRIREYGLENNVHILGFQKNPYKIVKNCKLIVMPSKNEGLGLTAIESMILGKVVLNSGVGGLGEIFLNTDFICKDLKDYCSKIISFLNKNIVCDEDLIKSLLKNYIDYDLWYTGFKSVYEE